MPNLAWSRMLPVGDDRNGFLVQFAVAQDRVGNSMRRLKAGNATDWLKQLGIRKIDLDKRQLDRLRVDRLLKGIFHPIRLALNAVQQDARYQTTNSRHRP